MNDKNKVVLEIYKTRFEAERCVDALKMDGFSTSDISVLMPDPSGSQNFAHTKGSKAPEGALIGLGIPEYEAKRYEGHINDGGILLSVHAATSDEVTKAKKCLEQHGAKDISSTGEVKGEWKSASKQDQDTTYNRTL
jgi:hypothetical protein